MANTSLDLTTDQAQELMIALRERAFILRKEISAINSGKPGAASIGAIAQRQLARLESVALPIAAQLGESF